MAVIALIAWIPICTLLFAFMTPVRAATLAYLGGWLLLPAMAIPIEGFWDFDKILATNCGVALGQLLFCSGQLRGYKVSLADVAVVAFAGGTFFSSIANGLGVYDGVASFGHKLLYYAVPFLVGRVCLKDRRSLLEAAEFIVYGAALYAILAVWEWRISPRIHITLYGVFPHSWSQHYRWGFFRPIVCFPHALGLGIFMAGTL